MNTEELLAALEEIKADAEADYKRADLRLDEKRDAYYQAKDEVTAFENLIDTTQDMIDQVKDLQERDEGSLSLVFCAKCSGAGYTHLAGTASRICPSCQGNGQTLLKDRGTR